MGIDILSFDTNLFGDETAFTTATGQSSGEWDFSNLKKELDRAVETNPEVKFFIRAYAGAPTWWMDKNPTEIERAEDGCEFFFSRRNPQGDCEHSPGKKRPNLFSPVTQASPLSRCD